MTRNSPRLRKQLLRSNLALLLVGATLSFVNFLGATPLTQELFKPSPQDDLRFGATRQGGQIPAAMKTRSGVVSLSSAEQGGTGVVYGAPEQRNGYRLDRFVQAPLKVQYDDPFRPSLIPYKRSVAYDIVLEDFNFSIAQARTEVLLIGGTPRADEDAFFGDIRLELIEQLAVSLPTVGPNASLRALELDPPIEFEVYQDSAANWWIVAQTTAQVHALLQISLPRQTFGSQFLPVGFASLRGALASLPENVRQAGLKMAKFIGVDASESPAHTLMRLVQYFRAFEQSDQSAEGSSTEAIFYELTQSQRGVCRHRAYAFASVAMSIGIPTRFVHNEAHAWVEVWDSQLWHQIDLGGAPAELEQVRDLSNTPSYMTPRDPYSWPKQSRPGRTLAAAAQNQNQKKEKAGVGTNEENIRGDSLQSQTSKEREALARTRYEQRRAAQRAEQVHVSLNSSTQSLFRGEPYIIRGKAEFNEEPCAFTRIDISLVHSIRGAGGTLIRESREIGSLASDEQGKFGGQFSIPLDLKVGDYSVVGSVAGECSASRR